MDFNVNSDRFEYNYGSLDKLLLMKKRGLETYLNKLTKNPAFLNIPQLLTGLNEHKQSLRIAINDLSRGTDCPKVQELKKRAEGLNATVSYLIGEFNRLKESQPKVKLPVKKPEKRKAENTAKSQSNLELNPKSKTNKVAEPIQIAPLLREILTYPKAVRESFKIKEFDSDEYQRIKAEYDRIEEKEEDSYLYQGELASEFVAAREKLLDYLIETGAVDKEQDTAIRRFTYQRFLEKLKR